MHRIHGLITLAVFLVAMSACSPQAPDAESQDLSNSKNYSLTQTIQNNSGQDLTVQAVTADNGGTVVPGYPGVINKGASGTFKATNTGNGVQTKVTLIGTDGQILVVDSDVPKVQGNWSTASITGTGVGLSAGDISIGGGDNPTASLTLGSCSEPSKCVTTTTTDPTPPLGDPSKTPSDS